MRAPPVLLALGLLLSGCSGDPPESVEAEPDPVVAATPPEDLVFTGRLQGLGDAAAVNQCALGDRQCAEHTVSVPEGNWTVTFTLVGTDGPATSPGLPYGTDYDLFVDGLGESTNPSGEPDVVTGKPGAGDLVARVVAWHDVDGAYTLTVSFE
jgi:hypothetical protein